MGTDRVCGMDEFRVEVVNVAEEAERLKEAAKAAAKSKDKEGDEDEEEKVAPGIPCEIQVGIHCTALNISCRVQKLRVGKAGRVIFACRAGHMLCL